MRNSGWIRPIAASRLALVLLAVGLGLAAGCGGGERLTREEFSARLKEIDRRGSEQFARLAERAMRLERAEPVPPGVRGGMRSVATSDRRLAEELERLAPPEEAEAATDDLVEALREHAVAFDRASGLADLTMGALEREGSIEAAGEKIDAAFGRLRRQGLFSE